MIRKALLAALLLPGLAHATSVAVDARDDIYLVAMRGLPACAMQRPPHAYPPGTIQPGGGFTTIQYVYAQRVPCRGIALGLPPVKHRVSPGETLTFAVTGSVSTNIGTGSNENDADGVGAAVGKSYNTGYGAVSGIAAPYAGYLVGVFVAAGGPNGAPPPALDFTGPGATAFAALSPQLDQVFFIGDGLSGDGAGTRQKFHIPAGAALLYLGLSDAGGYAGPPGWYQDNAGVFNVTVRTLK